MSITINVEIFNQLYLQIKNAKIYSNFRESMSKTFKYTIKVVSSRSTRGVVRIFMAPTIRVKLAQLSELTSQIAIKTSLRGLSPKFWHILISMGHADLSMTSWPWKGHKVKRSHFNVARHVGCQSYMIFHQKMIGDLHFDLKGHCNPSRVTWGQSGAWCQTWSKFHQKLIGDLIFDLRGQRDPAGVKRSKI